MSPALRSMWVAVGLAVFAAPLFAQTTAGPRRREPVSHSEVQAAMAARHAGYAAFRARAGGDWMARFDEEGGNPAMIVGSGIRVSDAPIATIDEAARFARETLAAYPELWGAPIADLELASSVKTGPLYVFTWQQRFQGLTVRRARVQIQVHEAGRVSALGTSAVAIPPTFSRVPALRPDQAEASIRAGKQLGTNDRIETVEFLVFAVRAGGVTTPRLAYAIDVVQPSILNFERVFVDADRGDVLEVERRLYDSDVKGVVSANVNAGLLPTDPLVFATVEGAVVTVSKNAAVLGSVSTNADGEFLFPTALTGPFTVSVTLGTGPWCSVITKQGAPLATVVPTAPIGGFDVAIPLLNAVPAEFATAQATAGYFHAVSRKYALSKIPAFTPTPNQLVFVNQKDPIFGFPGTCNAFYNPADLSLIFLAAGGGCVNTAYSTVIAHEYGHFVDDAFGQILSSALSEALGDTFAMYETGQPILGAGFSGPGTSIRTGENFTTWPDALTNCASVEFPEGEPHCVGETFMGFAWNARKNLVTDLGATSGTATSEKDLLGTFAVNNDSILDAVTEAFLLDDDDGNLANGVPHYAALAKAATKKGFVPPQFPFLLFPSTIVLVGDAPLAVTIGDLNGDGKSDLVTANADSSSTSVLIGNGLGGFGAPTLLIGGSEPHSVLIADLDGNGKQDLVAANYGSKNVSAFLGNGLGAFGAPTSFPVAGGPYGAALGDLNGDGKPDVVTGNFDTNNVSVLLGNGVGGFGAAANFGVGASAGSVALGDLNADGKLDAAVSASLSIRILLGNGLGGFGAPSSIFVGAIALALGDLNADGKPDIASTDGNLNKAWVLLGNGLGGFGTPAGFAVGLSPRGVAVGDLSGDGKLDVLSANASSNSVSVLLGNGAGSLAAAVNYAVGSRPYFVAIGNLNGDGSPDVVTADVFSEGVSVLLGNGLGQFAAMASFAVGGTPESVAVGDLNGDGAPDAVTANLGSDDASVLLGNGLGGFGTATNIALGPSAPQAVAIGDLNRDGKPDLVIAKVNSSNVSVLLGNGLGGFGAPVSLGVGAFPLGVAIGDLSEDGKPDVVTANSGADTVSVLLGNGLGGFGPPTSFFAGMTPWGIAIGDTNADGNLDVATPNKNADMVTVLFGNGLGGLPSSYSSFVGSDPRSVAIGDLNGDGKSDVVSGDLSGRTVSVLLADAFGGFDLATSFDVVGNPTSVAIGDLNGDGKADVVASAAGASVLLGDGLGSLGAVTNFLAGTYPSSLALADINGDGRPDLVTSNFGNSAGSVSVALNQTPTPSGTMPYGFGTPGCDGILGIAGKSVPSVGNGGFALVCTNAPRNALGTTFLAGLDDLYGTVFPGAGLLLHVNLASYITSIPLKSDASGCGYGAAPIPNDSTFAGKSVYVQAIWFEPAGQACSKAALGLVSSKGLRVTIQP